MKAHNRQQLPFAASTQNPLLVTVLLTSGLVVQVLVGPGLPAHTLQSSFFHHCLELALLQKA